MDAGTHPGEEAVEVGGGALRQIGAAPGQRHERGVHQEVGVGLPPAALVLAAPCAEARTQLRPGLTALLLKSANQSCITTGDNSTSHGC